MGIKRHLSSSLLLDHIRRTMHPWISLMLLPLPRKLRALSVSDQPRSLLQLCSPDLMFLELRQSYPLFFLFVVAAAAAAAAASMIAGDLPCRRK
ncbi:hypothetical protein Bca101_040464 [Brassica carinata]